MGAGDPVCGFESEIRCNAVHQNYAERCAGVEEALWMVNVIVVIGGKYCELHCSIKELISTILASLEHAPLPVSS